MADEPGTTSKMDTDQAWEVVWSELQQVGIMQGEAGPIDGSIFWGKNAERAIRGLQISTQLSAIDISNIGLLVQAAIHAAEVYRKKPRI